MMPVYLGSWGRLVKLPYVGSQQVQAEERYNFSSTLEGKRKAQVKPKGPRTWALSADHFRPNEHSLLSQFADGAWGPGPFVFVSTDAPVTNLLSPGESMCLYEPANPNVKSGPSVNLGDDGWSPRSHWHLDPASGSEIYFSLPPTPVLGESPVTGSAWVNGDGARVRLYWYDADDHTIAGTASSAGIDSADGWKRVSVSSTPPPGAVGVRLVAQYATYATRPAVTWTDEAFEWSTGEGCSKSVVHSLSKDLVLSTRQRGGQFSNVSFTVSEVG